MSYKHVPTETYGTSLDILEQLLMHSDHLAKLSQQYIILEYEDKHRNLHHQTALRIEPKNSQKRERGV